MKPTLQLRLGQQLTMTPQLQQAIKLLQLSTLDLQQEIQQAIENNPLLEQDEAEQLETLKTSEDSSEIDTTEALTRETMPEELPMDTTWDEVFTSAPMPTPGGGFRDDGEFTYQGETSQSLQDYLLWQMELTPFTDTDQAIALAIIDAIDDSGYLRLSTEEVQDSVSHDERIVELDEVEAVLKRVQHFDPLGVAARSAQECMQIQLSHLPADTPKIKEAFLVIDNHMDLLANRDYRTLSRKTKLKEDELREVMRLIHTLEPRPGNSIVESESQYIVPDVSIGKKNGRWVVELNPDSMPKLRVNDQYAAMSKQTKNSSDSQFIRSHLQEAKWFIKSLESRNDTLLKVSNCIVQHQQAFFEYGDEAMKPMVLNDVAEAVEMHESTISRVTTQKYMHTPRGIYELKYFFSSHVSTDGGGECSSTAIRALIKKLVAAEIPAKPLSDNKIAQVLADQGIKVARRTIAKYRESLNIPPSNQRKSLL